MNKLIFFYAELEKLSILPSHNNFLEKPKDNPYTASYSNDYIKQF